MSIDELDAYIDETGVEVEFNEDEYSIEEVGLKFKPWSYPSLEEAVLQHTMGYGYEDIYSHTSRSGSINNGLLPKTIVHRLGSKEGSVIVYSPYEHLIGRVIKTDEDWKEVSKYMRPHSHTKVLFTFIPYTTEAPSIPVSSDED